MARHPRTFLHSPVSVESPVEARLPCLLDRLIDEEPSQTGDAARLRTLTLADYRQAVLRDLRWLLNSPRRLSAEDSAKWITAPRLHPHGDVYQFPAVATSVLNFGTRDLGGLTTDGMDTRQLEQDVEDAIKSFEPRILPETVRVRILDDYADMGKIAFEITGQLWAMPHAERIAFRTEMDLETGACELTASR